MQRKKCRISKKHLSDTIIFSNQIRIICLCTVTARSWVPNYIIVYIKDTIFSNCSIFIFDDYFLFYTKILLFEK